MAVLKGRGGINYSLVFALCIIGDVRCITEKNLAFLALESNTCALERLKNYFKVKYNQQAKYFRMLSTCSSGQKVTMASSVMVYLYVIHRKQ